MAVRTIDSDSLMAHLVGLVGDSASGLTISQIVENLGVKRTYVLNALYILFGRRVLTVGKEELVSLRRARIDQQLGALVQVRYCPKCGFVVHLWDGESDRWVCIHGT